MGAANPPLVGVGDRGAILPDVSQVGPLAEVQLVLNLEPAPAGPYARLTPEECAARASDRSPIGNLLAAERRAVAARTGCLMCSEGDHVFRRILLAAEAEARSLSARAALESFYRLAQAEAQLDLARESQAEIDRTLADIQRLRERGLDGTLDSSELTEQRLAIAHSQVELAGGSTQLRADLQSRMGFAPHSDPIWPDDDWTVRVEPIDAELEVQVALSSRADIRVARLVAGSLDELTLGAVRHVLQAADGLAGVPASDRLSSGLRRLFVQRAVERETAARRPQAAMLVRQRQEQAALEGGLRQ